MKRFFPLFLLLCLASFVLKAQSQETGIQFFQGSLKEALTAAKQQKKLVFVDFYAVWCGPCKRMAKEVFTQDSVGRYFNDRFISVQLDAEKGENVDLAKHYRVEAFPTVAFLNAEGKAITQHVGAMNGGQLLEAARIAAGEAQSFEDLYEQYRKKPSDLNLQQALLLKAPNFLTAQEGMDAEKWAVRIRKLYTNYIAAKKGESLINKQDYLIISSLGGNDKEETQEMIEFINSNLPAWRSKVGNAAAYYVVEGNDARIEALIKAGDENYKTFVDKVATDYADAYAVVSLENLPAADRIRLQSDALFLLYKHKDVEQYLQLTNQLLQRLGENATPADYAKAAQELYYAAGDKLNTAQHQQALEWLQTALKDENTAMNRVNYLVMMGDSYRAMKTYDKARDFYQQAYVESLPLKDMEMVQEMLQAAIAKKLAELELLEK